MPPLLIPRTDIELLYKDVCKRPGGPQTRLDWAAREDPVERLAAAFARSIEQLQDYENDEPFRDPRTKAKTEADVDDAGNTISVALRLKKQGRLEAPGDDTAVYRYVEREVVAQRTTGGARFDDPRQELADGGRASSAMKVDLLLEAEDGAPAVGEIKIREDKDPICALIQVLAAAALLSTESQRARLDEHHNLRTDGLIDAVILLVQFPDRAPMQEARDRAGAIAAALLEDPRVNAHVRRIVAFEATADATEAGGPLTAEVVFRAEGVVAA